MERFEQFVAELREHYFLDQLLAQLPAAAVRQHYLPIVGHRERTSSKQGAGDALFGDRCLLITDSRIHGLAALNETSSLPRKQGRKRLQRLRGTAALQSGSTDKSFDQHPENRRCETVSPSRTRVSKQSGV